MTTSEARKRKEEATEEQVNLTVVEAIALATAMVEDLHKLLSQLHAALSTGGKHESTES